MIYNTTTTKPSYYGRRRGHRYNSTQAQMDAHATKKTTSIKKIIHRNFAGDRLHFFMLRIPNFCFKFPKNSKYCSVFM